VNSAIVFSRDYVCNDLDDDDDDIGGCYRRVGNGYDSLARCGDAMRQV
jgi:hypothetical protein